MRQELTLEAMLREGYISREALAAARFAPLTVSPGIEERFDIIAPHFALYVRRELERRFGPQQVLRGGLRVYTSLDLDHAAPGGMSRPGARSAACKAR
jgi:penicillin-binding protein 1A